LIFSLFVTSFFFCLLIFGSQTTFCVQQIWNDIGESEKDKDRMLMELERECLDVYRRKVDEAANTKARFHQSLAAKEAEIATLVAALGEHDINSPVNIN
jgi:protein regulator of cytokinesis 1